MDTIRRAWLLWALGPLASALADAPQAPTTSSVWIDVYTGEPLPYEAVLKDLATVDVRGRVSGRPACWDVDSRERISSVANGETIWRT
jgi:hypothetical protein